MQTIAISIDTETLRRVDRLRSVEGKQSKPTSRSELIRRALLFYANEQERLAWEAKDGVLYKKHKKMVNAQMRATLADQAEL